MRSFLFQLQSDSRFTLWHETSEGYTRKMDRDPEHTPEAHSGVCRIILKCNCMVQIIISRDLEDHNEIHLLIPESTVRKMIAICAAEKRKSLHGVDVTIADGVKYIL